MWGDDADSAHSQHPSESLQRQAGRLWTWALHARTNACSDGRKQHQAHEQDKSHEAELASASETGQTWSIASCHSRRRWQLPTTPCSRAAGSGRPLTASVSTACVHSTACHLTHSQLSTVVSPRHGSALQQHQQGPSLAGAWQRLQGYLQTSVQLWLQGGMSSNLSAMAWCPCGLLQWS